MVVAIQSFFRKYLRPSPDRPEEVSDHSLQIATAALLTATMRADGDVGEDEHRAVTKTLQSRFDLSEAETKALLTLAQKELWNATGYYEFTSLINKSFTYEQKVKIVEHLWEVAFADAHLDKHEEHAIRKIANLIYVEHKDFIDAKLRVKKHLHGHTKKVNDR